MSYEYHQFTLNLTLQHISMIKICQQLWRQSDVSSKIESILYSEDEAARAILAVGEWPEINDYVIKKLDDLNLPRPMKHHLRYYLKSIARGMFRWLRDMRNDMMTKGDPNCAIKINYFIKNPTWDDFGSVHGRRMLESYVRTRESIDYDTWRQLCCHCSEDHIRRYGKCIDWGISRQIDSMLSVFWYYKVQGTFPMDGMFSSMEELQKFDRAWRDGRLDENHIAKTMFYESIVEGNISGVRYFWKDLEEREKHEVLTSGLSYFYHRCKIDCSEAYVFLLGQMDRVEMEYFLVEPLEIDRLMIVMDWPWIMCVESWKNIFLAVSQQDMRIIMARSLSIMDSERCARYYQVVEELCKTYRNLSGEQDIEDIIRIGRQVVFMKDIRLCKVLFENVRIRRCVLDRWELVFNSSDCKALGDDFFREFIEDVLGDDDERKLFKNSFYGHLGNPT